MSRRQITVLLVVLVFLVGLIVIKRFQKPQALHLEEHQPITFDIPETAVKKIIFGLGQHELILVKVNNEWRIPEKWNSRADLIKVDGLLERLKNLKGELRSANREALSDYQIDDEQALRIGLGNDEKTITTILFGKKITDDGVVFVRLKDRNEVYSMDADVLPIVGLQGAISGEGLKADHWLDLHFFRVEENAVSEMVIASWKKGERTENAHLVKQGALWKSQGVPLAFDIDTDLVVGYMKQLKLEQARLITDPSIGFAWDHPDWMLEYRLANGDSGSLSAKLKEGSKESDYYVKQSGNDTVFLIAKHTLDRMDRTAEQFMSLQPFRERSKNWQRIVVRQNDKIVQLVKENAADGKQVWKSDASNITTDQAATFINQLENVAFERISESQTKTGGPKLANGLTLEITDDHETIVLLFSSDVDGQGYRALMRQGFPQMLQVSPEEYKLVSDLFLS